MIIFIDFLSHFIDHFTIFLGYQNPGPDNINNVLLTMRHMTIFIKRAQCRIFNLDWLPSLLSTPAQLQSGDN
jgi:hypothetical protein